MQRGKRIILYSHDTFGPGHLRRSWALAAALTEEDPTASALILTGSRLAGDFILPERVDHVRLPGVTQRADGSYAADALGLDIDEMTALRASLIKSAVAAFDPDLLIVDEEPTGFRGELLPTLEALTGQRPARIALSLSNVFGDRDVLATEWECRKAIGVTERYYDEVWVHGSNSFHDQTDSQAPDFSEAGIAQMASNAAKRTARG